jgi:hypothetical protein
MTMSPVRVHGGVLALFVVLTVLATWPLAAHFTNHVPGNPRDPGDYWAYYWDLWWVKSALVAGHDPLHTRLLYHPDGTSLYFHSLLLGPGTLVTPVTAVLGPTVSYNLLVWLSFFGSAAGVYALFLSLAGPGASRLAAALAGVVYAFSAYRFSRMMGHLDLLSTEWLPFAALFLLRSVREGGGATRSESPPSLSSRCSPTGTSPSASSCSSSSFSGTSSPLPEPPPRRRGCAGSSLPSSSPRS